MDFRRTLDVVLRAPLTTSSATTSLTLRRAAIATRQCRPSQQLLGRTVSTTASPQAAAPARKPRDDNDRTAARSSSPPSRPTATGQTRIDQLLNEMGHETNRGRAFQRPALFKPSTNASSNPTATATPTPTTNPTSTPTPTPTPTPAPTTTRAPAQPKPKPSGTSSIQDFLDQLGLSPGSSSADSPFGSRRGVQVDRMAVPGSAYRDQAGTLIDPSIMRTNFATAEGPDMAAPSFQLGPSLGRTVVINTAKSMDLARAFRALEGKCTANSVRRDFIQTRFHERPGLKRKRLRQVRWRARFKAGFSAIVRRVEDMRRKGW